MFAHKLIKKVLACLGKSFSEICKNYILIHIVEKHILYFYNRVPLSDPIRTKWIKAIGLKECIPNKLYFVCEHHFEEIDFQNPNSYTKKLKSNAFPTCLLVNKI